MIVGAESPFAIQSRVVGALILRDMRTRFGGTYYGYVIAILWPFCHLAIVAIVQVAIPRPSPAGESTLLFFTTGLLPYVTFLYMSRNLTLSVRVNLPLLYFPVVRISDIVIARTIVEIGTSFMVGIIVMSILYAAGIDIRPQDPILVFEGYLATVALGLSVGIFNNAVNMIVPQYFIFYIIMSIGLYIGSGILFIAEGVPEKYRYYLLFNPLMQTIEWVRSGYYVDYGMTTLSIPYTLGFCLCAMALGLLIQHAFGGRAVRT